MIDNALLRNGQMVSALYSSARSGKAGLSSVPGLLKQIIESEMWRSFLIEETGQVIEHSRFADFVATHPPEGLGATVEMLVKLCADHPDVLDLIDGAVKGQPGKTWDSRTVDRNITDNISNNTDMAAKNGGTGQQAGLRRLRAEIAKASPNNRPKIEALQAKVFANEISVHAALVEIGARRKTATIPLDVEGAARAIKRQFTPDQIDELIDLLSQLPTAEAVGFSRGES